MLPYVFDLVCAGEGSVFAQLKAAGWASSLVSGESGQSMSCASFFYVRCVSVDTVHARVDLTHFLAIWLCLASDAQTLVWQHCSHIIW